MLPEGGISLQDNQCAEEYALNNVCRGLIASNQKERPDHCLERSQNGEKQDAESADEGNDSDLTESAFHKSQLLPHLEPMTSKDCENQNHC